MRRRLVAIAILAAGFGPAAPAAQELLLAGRPGSLKLAVIGDNGTGEQPQYDVAEQLARFHARFPFDTVVMLGDNMYGSQKPQDFVAKFERPYAPLLDAGVKFFAALGNHDLQSNRSYAPFGMGGERYYTYVKQNARFFVLDSNYLEAGQLRWFEEALQGAAEDWKICYFHHPLYSDARRHGSNIDLRVVLEPLLVRYGVQVVLSGHEHVYERIKPQKGITYFVDGSSGQLRKGDLEPSRMTAAGFDQDRTFMLLEIDGDEFHFQTISRSGNTVDSGVIRRARTT